KNDRLAKVIPRLDQYCQKTNVESVQFASTVRKKHAIELARQATEKGSDFLIAVGGDGTLNEVINGMMQAGIPANEYPAIGLLSYGSANDFARTARIPHSIEDLMALIQSNTTRKIDL